MVCTRQRFWSVALLTISISGCVSPKKAKEYSTVPSASLKDTQTSKDENNRGLHFAEARRFEDAEKAFRQALESDVGNAAAHNNLGLVLLARHRFYESAVEFRLASKLDHSAIEPVMNLGRLYEIIGWQREAAKQYEDAERLRSRSVNAAEAILGEGRLVDHQ